MRYALLFCLPLLFPTGAQAGSGKATLYRWPSLSRTHITFSYGADLWIVEREGGRARRLTTGVGVESMPVLSPDGSLIAFSADYEGNFDVYVVPAAGGEPRRLT
jgi:tricorn protease